jgi:hypothetical protein
MTTDHFCSFGSRAFDRKEDYDRAIADFDETIRLDRKAKEK